MLSRHYKVFHRLVKLYRYQPQFTRCISQSPLFGTTSLTAAEEKAIAESPTLDLPDNTVDDFRERFIPITRRSLVQQLMEERDFLNHEELIHFEELSLALDATIERRFHGVLQELKTLFDPLNPDKDTIGTRRISRKQQLDNEFWLLQRLSAVLNKANFHELPRPVIERSLATHSAAEGVMVSVDLDKYEVLRFWALGKEQPPPPLPWYRRLSDYIQNKPQTRVEFYKRVVAAVRLKGDHKLLLKAFKEVPVTALEQLLPDGRIEMTRLDRGIITTSVALAGMGVLAKTVSWLASVELQWTLVSTIVVGLIGTRAWTVYKNRRNNYLLQLNRMLYYKNIANNRGLLALLVDRAQDETFKEVLLTYTHLLCTRASSTRQKAVADMQSQELGGLPDSLLETQVESWVARRSDVDIEFDCSEAAEILHELGLLQRDGNQMFVLPLTGALKALPRFSAANRVLSERMEVDLAEGWDRVRETAQLYKLDDSKRRRFGWW